MLETIYAVEGLAVKANDRGLFFVFADGKPVDRFTSYNEAHSLLQELFIARGTTEDKMIGQVKFCADDIGNGMLVAVIGKAKDGYLVQPIGGRSRFVVSANELQEPPTIDAAKKGQ
jgi:hypothetical protein